MSHRKHTLAYMYVCMYTTAERNLYAFCCKSTSTQYRFSSRMFKFLLTFNVKNLINNTSIYSLKHTESDVLCIQLMLLKVLRNKHTELCCEIWMMESD